jgi:glycosyltransferase involved in cell wall biosynthesis
MTQRKLNIVQVLPALQSGGVERGTLELGQYLAAKDHRSIVISAGGRLVEQLVNQGSEHIKWDIGRKSIFTLRLIPRLRRFLTENQIDILHARSRFPAWICYLAWKGMDPATRPNLITTVHGAYSVNAYSAVMTKGEQVIVISEMIRDYVLKHYAVHPDKLRLNYRGVAADAHPYGYQPSAQWLNDWYQCYPQTKDKKLITLPARITRWKGQQDFIDLIARLKTEMSDVHGLIVGETKPGKNAFLEELKARAVSLDVADHITFTGHRSDIREVMAISNIVFSLSREPEAFGRTTIEALSLGIPVIGYAHGGVEEQLKAVLPAGRIAVGDLATATELTLSWLQQAPKVPAQHPFRLQHMLANTLAIYQQTVCSNSAI